MANHARVTRRSAAAADSLHQVRRDFDWHSGVYARMSGRQESVEARLRHRRGDDGADIGRRNAGIRKDCTRRLDSQVYR